MKRRAEFYRQETGLPAIRFIEDNGECKSIYLMEAIVENPEKLISSSKPHFTVQGYTYVGKSYKPVASTVYFEKHGEGYEAPYCVCFQYMVELCINMNVNKKTVSMIMESTVAISE